MSTKSGFRGINKVILVGVVGMEPEVRQISDDRSVCNISVATNEAWTDKASGEHKTRVEWHRVAMFARLAEIGAEYLGTGSKVYIEGSLRTSSYEKDGETRYSTQIVAMNLQLLGGSRGESSETREVATETKKSKATARKKPVEVF